MRGSSLGGEAARAWSSSHSCSAKFTNRWSYNSAASISHHRTLHFYLCFIKYQLHDIISSLASST